MNPEVATALTDTLVEMAHPQTDYRTTEGKKAREFLIPILKPYIVRKSRLPGLGCGMGGATFLAASVGTEAVGIDCTRKAVDFASTVVKDTGLSARFAVRRCIIRCDNVPKQHRKLPILGESGGPGER